MANNVYIGMRYVPIFDGAWDSSKSYEALVIVEYGNNTYTSKKPVPAGTLPTNTTYWALTGNYNGQIATINNTLTSLQDQILNRKKNLTKRKFMIVGDSYSVISDNWVGYFKSYLGLSDSQIVNVAVSGQGFYVGTTTGFLNQITNYAGDKTAITDMLVIGGLNDSGITDSNGYNALRTAIQNFCAYAKTNYPNADIYVGYVGGQLVTHPSFTYANYEGIDQAKSLYIELAHGDYTYLSGVENVIHETKGFYQNDGVHPNQYGSQAIARGIINAYLTGYAEAAYPSDVSLQLNTGYFTAVNDVLSMTVENNHLNIRFTSMMDLSLKASTAFSGEILVGNFGRHIINRKVQFMTYALVQWMAGGWTTVPIAISFEENHMYVLFLEVNQGGQYISHTTGSSGGHMYILGNEWSIDSPYFN